MSAFWEFKTQKSKFKIAIQKSKLLKTSKFLLVFLTFNFYLFTFIAPAFAQSLPPATMPLPATVQPTSPVYTDLFVYNMFHTFSCIAVGSSVIGQPCLTYQLTKNAQGLVQGVPYLSSANLSGGLLGTTTGLIAGLFANPPVRTSDYLATIGQDLGIKEAHAQVVGSGAQVLSPVIKLWQVSRNISYVFMIVIFLIIGLMVMFRQRINPQTVITAQAALPRLVIGLILITFSFFLAGLISDTAFVGTNLVGYYFAAASNDPTALSDPTGARTNLVGHISDKSVLDLFAPLTGIVTRDDASGFLDKIFYVLPGSTQFILRGMMGFMYTQFMSQFAGGAGGLVGLFAPGAGLAVTAITNIAAGITGFVAPTFGLGFVLGFVATLALIYAMIRLFLRLISAFLTIIFLTITAPFQFLVASLPGRQGVATGWILNMLANILVFPAVLVIFYFVAFILGPDLVNKDSPGKQYPLKVSNSNQIEYANLVKQANAASDQLDFNGPTLPLFGGLDFKFMRILLAFGALLALPGIPELVIRTVGRAGQAGQLLGQEISSGVRGGQGYAGQFQGAVGGGAGIIKRNIAGETGYVYDPYTRTFEYRATAPGLRQIQRGGSWNPFKWTVKSGTSPSKPDVSG